VVLQGASCVFFNALLWMALTGAAWRGLPERLSQRSVVYPRYAY
jgi:transposase